MNADASQPLIIPLSRKKSLFALVGCLAFVAVCLWMLWSTETAPFHRGTVKSAAVVGIVFFGFIGLYIVVKLFDPQPGLVIDAEGLIDHSSGVAVGRVPWRDIVGLKEAVISGQRFIAVLVTDPESYIARGGRLKRLANQANFGMTGSPVNLSANMLRIRHDELYQILVEALDRSRSDRPEA